MKQRQIMTLKETADYLGVSMATINRLKKDDDTFPFHKINRNVIRVVKSELDNWVINSDKYGLKR